MNLDYRHNKADKTTMYRTAYRAGTFYPGTRAQCQTELQRCIPETVAECLGQPMIAAVVPHAGWVYSGATAGKVYRALQQNTNPSTIVIFGAVHVYGVDICAVYTQGNWQTPLGEVAVDQELATKLLAQAPHLIKENPYAHTNEHSIEVQIPFIQTLFPQAKILPIMIEPCSEAVQIGKHLAQIADDKVIVIASSDMTHYGERFCFTPAGTGERALQWVKETNDRNLIEKIIHMSSEEIVPESMQHHNACGAGAIAATVSFAKAKGKDKGTLLGYTTSWDVDQERPIESFVGYAGIIF